MRKLVLAGDSAADGGGSGGTYVDDVFSTDLWSTASINENASIDNGVDLAGEGGLIWLKNRDIAGNNTVFDSERGLKYGMYTDGAGEQWDTEGFGFTAPTFNEGGYTTGTANVYTTAGDHVGWTFRKAPGFFDVVTYTGDGSLNRSIQHNLGVTPAMIILKAQDNITAFSYMNNWEVYHKDLGNWPTGNVSRGLFLNTTDSSSTGAFNKVETQTSTHFRLMDVGSDARGNMSGTTYVAYLFAHDAQEFGADSDESIIKCGGYTGNQTAGNEVDLGFEPQFVLIKAASGAGEWYMFDTMRGIVTGGFDPFLRANMSAAESASSEQLEVNPTGFSLSADINVNTSNIEYIYMAIRRPNKPAEEFEPEELFETHLSTSTPGTANEPIWVSGFPVDFAFQTKPSSTLGRDAQSRLAGENFMDLASTAPEYGGVSYAKLDTNEGWGTGSGPPNHQAWMWRRAPGFFDVVTYTGSTINTTSIGIPHNLGVEPEMAWIKKRDSLFANAGWNVYLKEFGTSKVMYLNSGDELRNDNDNAFGSFGEDKFTPGGTNYQSNYIGAEYIAYLFASVPGISKVGSYTGNGSEVTVDCGFTNGARWLLIKRTNSAGDWYFTSNPNNFKTLSKINKYEAQVNYMSTYNDVPSGFRVTSTSGDLCVNGGEYIFYAIA